MSAPFAVYVTAIGGPEVLQAQPIAMPVPGADEVVIITDCP